MAPKAVATTTVEGDPQRYEDANVHSVYDEIAPHFSSTRYKPWPIISKFLSSVTTGWVGLDSGTGNGKYLPLPVDRPGEILTIGLDRSINLLKIARKAGEGGAMREVVWGDALGDCWRPHIFDYAISIATIHHLATHERRKRAVQSLIKAVSRSHGRILIYVWAIEQDELSKRAVPTGDDNGLHLGQDVMVPWVLSKELRSPKANEPQPDEPQVFNRYYHMFSRGELGQLVYEACEDLRIPIGKEVDGSPYGVEIVQDGWERSNYYVELRCWKSNEQ